MRHARVNTKTRGEIFVNVDLVCVLRAVRGRGTDATPQMGVFLDDSQCKNRV